MVSKLSSLTCLSIQFGFVGPWLLLLFFFTVSANAQESANSSSSIVGNSENPPARGLDANLYMQISAEYRAACYQAFNLATLRLDESLEKKVSSVGGTSSSEILAQKNAIVMDLDETVLDNGGFQASMLRSGLAYDQRWFDLWEQYGGESVGLIPGAKEFILAAEKKGVTIVHISNRNERFRENTKRLLERHGIPVVDDRNLKLSTVTSDKTSRRKEVESVDGFHVLFYVGDNLRDFDDKFKMPGLSSTSSSRDLDDAIVFRKRMVDETRDQWGKHWIVLPNPAYGEWTKALGRGKVDLERLSMSGEQKCLAFWNVENLFDTVDDPNLDGDEEFTPSGTNGWTADRLEIKLNNLARVISGMGQGNGPDAMGLAEVENGAVVEKLIEKLKPLDRDYRLVHKDSPSDRGIDCAMLYDAKVFELDETKFHFVDAENTRDILEAKLSRNGRALTMFVNHWPSRGNDVSQRIEAGRVLRARVDELLRADSLADIVIVGDFNDFPTDDSLTASLKATADLGRLHGGQLFNSSQAVPGPLTGTYVYDDKWEIIDQVIFSPGMLVPGGIYWEIGSTRPALVVNDQLYDHSGPAIPRPSRSYSGTNFHPGGYSDHLPVVTSVFWLD